MAGRRNKQGNEPGRHWQMALRWSASLVLLMAVLAGGFGLRLYLSDPQTLPLRVVRIEGDFRHLQRADLEQAVAGAARGGFFSIDLQAVRDAALDLPWVATVSVRRIWPDTLSMWVSEQVPVALWGDDGLVNAAGEVFRPQGKRPDGLPLLRGVRDEMAARMVSRLEQIREGFRALGLQPQELSLDARGSWDLRCANGLALALGNRDQDERLRRFMQLYPQLRRDGYRAERIDLRYSHGLAVKWVPAGENEQSNKQSGKGTA